jgi:hypothetical protein
VNAAAPDDTVVFLHVPKTAGNTVTSLLERHYAAARRYAVPTSPREIPPLDEIVAGLRSLPSDQLRKLDLLTGHFPFGVHAALPRRARYLTFVREPVERVVSLYYYIRSHPVHPLRGEANRLTLREFAEGNVSGNLHNGQTAFIAGKGIWHDRFDDALLAEALANIEHDFAAVGVTERMDESVLVLRRQLGWRAPVYYQSQNVNSARPRNALDPETAAAIEALNELDRRLYDRAADLLDLELERLGIDVQSELRALRARSSNAYRIVVDTRRRVRRLLRAAGAPRRG